MMRIFYFSIVLLFISCQTSTSTNSGKPGHAGKSGEVLVVLDRDLIGTALHVALEDAFSLPLKRSPQPEPRTSVRFVAKEDMADHSKLHRNLVFYEMGRPSKKVSVNRDVWSKGQLVLRIFSPDIESGVALVNEKAEQMVTLVEQEERLRTKVRLSMHLNEPLSERVFNEHGVRFIIPKDYNLVGATDRFVWLEVDRMKVKSGREHHALQGMLLYHYPFTSEGLLEIDSLHAKRDSVLKANVLGQTVGSYMTTEYKFRDIDLSPMVWETKHNDMYAIYQKGLWKMVNEFMGGPYVSMTQVDSVAGRIVTLEGYVYSPEFPKREFLREMDAIVHSLEVHPVSEITP